MSSEDSFRRKYLGEFPKMGHEMGMDPLDKDEITELINMMFRFQLRTGSEFKIEEYAESVFVLTDINKLTGGDVASFHRKNHHICNKIWFAQISPSKQLVNVYEDCPKTRRIYYPPYNKGCHFLNILNRTQSISFILDN